MDLEVAAGGNGVTRQIAFGDGAGRTHVFFRTDQVPPMM